MKKSIFRNLENMGIVLPEMRVQGCDKGVKMKGNNTAECRHGFMTSILKHFLPHVLFHSLNFVVSNASLSYSELLNYFKYNSSIYVFFPLH